MSGQTVINHFGGKEPLAAAAHQRLSEGIVAALHAQGGRHPGPGRGGVDDYETTGDAVVRLLALEEKVPSPAAAREGSREPSRVGRDDVRRAGALPELIVATDVYTWKLLRRDQGLSRDETVAAMLRIVQALLERRTR